jgi:hypothetical protein
LFGLIKGARYFVGFPGGNTILSQHVGIPTCMLWNRVLKAWSNMSFRSNWVDPARIDSIYHSFELECFEPRDVVQALRESWNGNTVSTDQRVRKCDIVFDVPSGIGDSSWIYSKVSALAKKKKVGFALTCDYPRRSKQFLDLLPNVANLGYTHKHWSSLYNSCLPPKTAKLEELKNGRYTLSLNEHLESGNPLAQAFSTQPTEYHYPLLISEYDMGEAARMMWPVTRPLLGFYCSSMDHRPDVGFWSVKKWVEFLSLVNGHVPSASFMAIGAAYDDRTMQVAEAFGKVAKVHTCFGRRIGTSLEIVRRLDYFFAFPSGLGILADVVNTPCMMWFWGNLPAFKHHIGLFDKYADPRNVESGRHINAPYAEPVESFALFKKRGSGFISKAVRG